MTTPTPEEIEKSFVLVESAYRKWLKDYVPSNEEFGCLFGLAFAVLGQVDNDRMSHILVAGLTGAKPTSPIV